jgi:peptide/nickel transport system substrate-binding protein
VTRPIRRARRPPIATVALLALLLAAAPAGAARNPLPGTTVAIGAAGRVATLDPAQAATPAERLLVANLFDRLVARGADGGLRPSLAARWTGAADSLTWTFELRPGLTFADGRPIDAAAVVAAWARIGDAAPPGRRVAGLAAQAEGSRIVVTLDAPVADLPGRLADPLYGVAAPAKDPDGGSLVGSGPFRLVRADRPGTFVLAPRGDHPLGRPMPGRVVVTPAPAAPAGTAPFTGLAGLAGVVTDRAAGTLDLSLAWQPGPAGPRAPRPARSSR